MNGYEENSLRKRVENLESAVNEIQQTLGRLTDSSDRLYPDLHHKTKDAPVQAVSKQALGAAFTQHDLENDADVKPCPYCNKMIKKEAIKCRYCFKMIPEVHDSVIDKTIETDQTEAVEESSKTREEWEAFIGGELLNRIGALALIIAVGFFLKYAFDNNWINETMRVIIGIIVGTGLLAGGARFHRKGLPIFAQGLVGAGIPILYLSVYASFNFYQLVSQTTAFVLMSLVTVTAIQQAVKYNSFAVSLLGWIGGFLTPFLLNTGEVNAAGLFTYIVLLDAGLLAVLSVKDSWKYLEPLTLAATSIIYILWYGNNYSIENMSVAIVFLTIIWCMFCALDISRIKRNITSDTLLREYVSVANAVLFYWALYSIIEPDFHNWMAPVTLVIGISYFLTFLWTIRYRSESERNLVRSAYTAVVLLVIATGIHFSDFTLVVAWSLEALILFWCGFHFKLNYIVNVALGLFSLATIALMNIQQTWDYLTGDNYTFIVNGRFLTIAVLIASISGSIVTLKGHQEKYFDRIKTGLHFGWCLLLFFLCTVETCDFVTLHSTTALLFILAIVWMAYSLPLAWTGFKQMLKPLLICGVGASVFASITIAVKGFSVYEPLEAYAPVLNIRLIAFLIISGGLLVQAYRLKKGDGAYGWAEKISNIYFIAVVVLGFIALTVETRDFFEKAIVLLSDVPNAATSISRLSNMQQLSLSGAWLIYSIFLIGIGMWRKIQGFRVMSIALFGITIIKIFIYDLSFLDSVYRIVSFMGLGIILLLVSYLYQRYSSIIFKSDGINGDN